jgi:DNA-binding transcriptional LysR family regulator
LKHIAREFPNIEINLHRATAAEVLEELENGDVEIAIADSLDGGWERLDSWPLAYTRHYLVVNASHGFADQDEIDVAALAGERLLSLPGSSQSEALVAHLAPGSISYREVATIDDILSLVVAGAGVALLPEHVSLPLDLVRVDLAGVDLRTTVNLHAVAGRQRSPAAQRLVAATRGETEISGGPRQLQAIAGSW